ncbi:MAG TPA: peptidylprolyl isomerase [Thermoanaerobaculia bacterium]|nr:peptidylprolyl isomerase [Thermoanaerobaculia bacterium]
MQTAAKGDTVKVHYAGTLEDGSKFDSSAGGDPFQFKIGSGQVIDGFEDAIIGMKVGDRKRTTIPAENAYGEHEPDLQFEVSRKQVPEGVEIHVGDFLEIGLPDGSSAPMKVADFNEAHVTLDANHPLAGKTLIFDLELLEIE